MFIVSIASIVLGYALFYYGADAIKGYGKTATGTATGDSSDSGVTLASALGIPLSKKYAGNSKGNPSAPTATAPYTVTAPTTAAGNTTTATSPLLPQSTTPPGMMAV